MDQAFILSFLGVLLSHAVVEAELKNGFFFLEKRSIFGEEKKAHKRNAIVKP